MKSMKNYKFIGLFLLSLGIISCDVNNELEEIVDPIQPEIALNANGLDFSNYVAVGASFTAGFTDNGLFKASQENSFPNILASKFAMANGGNFVQPLMNDNFGGLAIGGTRITAPRLVFGGAGPVPLESIIGPVTVSTDIALNNPTGPFNNLGVPGAKSFHLIAPGYGNIANFPLAANPYAVRLTGSSPDKSILALAVEQSPTFFTLSEIGGNDVLGYATSGGDGSNPITDNATFDFALNTLVEGLTANGAKGAIANLPNITSLSYFTTVPHNPLPLDADTAAALNAGYSGYNAGIKGAFAFLVANSPMTQEMADEEIARRTIVFEAGATNSLVMIDEYLTDLTAINPALISMRQTTSADLITLPTSSLIPTGAGSATPLTDTSVLTPEEQNDVKVATDAYNASIAAVASAKGLALVDLNSVLAQASSSGIAFDEFTANTDLVTGGLVSLDGVHLTARGYALMANSFLTAIDATYGSNFSEASNGLAKANDYSAIYPINIP